jgi:tetratricopeptide (TPR) repeat protein
MDNVESPDVTKIVPIAIAVAILAWSIFVLGAPAGVPPTPEFALHGDPASPYRWCDLAEQYSEAGEIPRARACFARALQLGARLPQIHIRAANFHVSQSEPDRVLFHTTRVLEMVPDYDSVIFGYYDRLEFSPTQVLLAQWASSRAALSYFSYLLDAGRYSAALEAWPVLLQFGFPTDRTAAAYLNFLLRRDHPETAAQAWAVYLKDRRGDYLRPNHLFNGNFQLEPTGAPLDWNIQPHPAVEASREPGNGLSLRFNGTENVAFRHASQVSWVKPGRSVIRARIRTEDITTNEGIHIHVTAPGLDLRTEPLTGTHPWTPVELSFEVPPNVHQLTVSICRDPSKKFDNKIQGAAWVTAVTLTQGTV